MAKKKKNRAGRRAGSGSTAERSRSRGKGLLSTPSLIFIGLIVLMGVVAVAASMMRDGDNCPAGQVWSDSHGHCH